jgi:hypothetical protein
VGFDDFGSVLEIFDIKFRRFIPAIRPFGGGEAVAVSGDALRFGDVPFLRWG